MLFSESLAAAGLLSSSGVRARGLQHSAVDIFRNIIGAGAHGRGVLAERARSCSCYARLPVRDLHWQNVYARARARSGRLFCAFPIFAVRVICAGGRDVGMGFIWVIGLGW